MFNSGDLESLSNGKHIFILAYILFSGMVIYDYRVYSEGLSCVW